MATNYITIKGYIENGELKVDLPENVPDGEVEVTIGVDDISSSAADVSLTDEELDALMRPNPKTGAEIIAAGHTGGWDTPLPHELQDISPGSVIVKMMRTSMWDVYLDILKEVRE